MNKKKIIGVLLAGILLALGAAGCGAPAEEDVQQVDLTETVRTVEAFGRVRPSHEQTVLLDMAALVEDVHVREGDLIREGDPIFTLDLTDPAQTLQVADRQVERARLESAAVRDGINAEGRALLDQYRVQEIRERRLTEEMNRQQTLFAEGAISREELSQQERELEDLRRRKEEMKRDLSLLYGVSTDREPVNFLGGTRAKTALASEQQTSVLEAERSKVQAGLQRPHLQGNLVISDLPRAVITDIGYRSGDRTSPSQKAFTLSVVDRLVVEADILEEFIRNVREGQTVEIVPVADRTRTYQGTVRFLSNMAFARNGETVVPVEIEVINDDGFLRPNFNVDITIEIDS